MDTPNAPSRPKCSACPDSFMVGWGKDRKGNPRYRCNGCRKTVTVAPPRPLGPMRLPLEKALTCLHLLVEGMSVRGTERVTGVHRDTVCRLLVRAGQRAEALLDRLVQGVPVQDVQCDETWTFVAMKEKARAAKKIADPKVGDAYTFVGFERETKMVLAWHLGRRTKAHADAFAEKLDRATAGRFQVTTDGFEPYQDALGYHVGARTDYATLVKEYGYTEGDDSARRYSPPSIIGAERTVIHGNPSRERICTSHVERDNLSIRTWNRRLSRLTICFSKKWENLRAALALHFAHYNLCRMHSSIRMTPAMKADVTTRPWTLAELVAA